MPPPVEDRHCPHPSRHLRRRGTCGSRSGIVLHGTCPARRPPAGRLQGQSAQPGPAQVLVAGRADQAALVQDANVPVANPGHRHRIRGNGVDHQGRQPPSGNAAHSLPGTAAADTPADRYLPGPVLDVIRVILSSAWCVIPVLLIMLSPRRRVLRRGGRQTGADQRRECRCRRRGGRRRRPGCR